METRFKGGREGGLRPPWEARSYTSRAASLSVKKGTRAEKDDKRVFSSFACGPPMDARVCGDGTQARDLGSRPDG
ncbi:hypothetical protein VTI28DRAFT_9559 [Corynascus sepedonium]